ncbi:CDP-alcohol phosphatidyltransferase family protein [Microvirga sp. CF3062]|uniref:CDP-alcohol phosphatidyltransferase family protein n=1 Tax=Microvirga sp. CF3062 TaxID=3110182 RepID=UPI002E77A8BE|nr:CDP-alcohol phosphatidyltransferase family protein [Microvirga sp. CF3062]MEE1657640.1 CDP-alcohol phosphatidyltransferase family protein [Microvirga sp. CF3062]
MLDGWVRRRIDPSMDRLGQGLARAGVSADTVTLAGLGLGLAAALMIILGFDGAALILFGLNRLLDGLDGAVARSTQRTDRGGFLDIVLDFAIYGAIPLAFALRDPGTLALPAAVLLFSFYVNGASFLAFAAVAAKRGMSSDIRGIKSIYFTAGVMEGTETILFFVAMILFPQNFAVLAYAFAGLTVMSALARITLAWHAFRGEA